MIAKKNFKPTALAVPCVDYHELRGEGKIVARHLSGLPILVNEYLQK